MLTEIVKKIQMSDKEKVILKIRKGTVTIDDLYYLGDYLKKELSNKENPMPYKTDAINFIDETQKEIGIIFDERAKFLHDQQYAKFIINLIQKLHLIKQFDYEYKNFNIAASLYETDKFYFIKLSEIENNSTSDKIIELLMQPK